VPAAARGRALNGSVDLRWLICKDICIPDRATLAFALPLSSAERNRLATWRQQIADARAAVPASAPRGWKTSVTSTRDALVVAIATDRRIGGGTFFPIDEGVINESAPQRVDVKGTEITFTLQKSAHLLTLPARLRGVVVLASGEAFEVAGAVADATRGGLSSKE
jgi:DsbC/DsbD-like thiol-disulfide interchange protein